MEQKSLDWLYEHFMMDYSSVPARKDCYHQCCVEAAQASGEALFATFTQEQHQLYLRFEEDNNALEALRLRLFFQKVFRFAWELLR